MAKVKAETHSVMFEKLAYQYKMGYVSKETLKGRVALYETKPNKGITAEEYKEITGEDYTE